MTVVQYKCIKCPIFKIQLLKFKLILIFDISVRIFTIIFSMYIMALSVMPCSDVHGECNHNSELVNKAHDPDHPRDHDDMCSPFCACTCCNTLININLMNVDLKFKSPQASELIQFSLADFFYISNIYSKIWQPPKIS